MSNGATSYTADFEITHFKSNTYTANFYTGGKGLLHLDGMPRVEFNAESFVNNGDASRESIIKYSMDALQPATLEMTIP